MKNTISILALTLSLAVSGAASAGPRHSAGGEYDYVDRARVLNVKPIYETVRVARPETRCRDERVTHRYRSTGLGRDGGTLLGGVIGGVVGNQFGKGHGKDAMTVAGVLIGAGIGHELSHDRRPRSYSTVEEVCHTYTSYEEREELVGYRVKYRYNGRVYHQRMDHDPGKWVRVHVDVKPMKF